MFCALIASLPELQAKSESDPFTLEKTDAIIGSVASICKAKNLPEGKDENGSWTTLPAGTLSSAKPTGE